MKPLLLALVIGAALSLPALAEDWTRLLSPRMREEMRPMLGSHWSPKREVELTSAEKRDLAKLTPRLETEARQFLRQEQTPAPTERPIRENKGF